MKGGFGLFVVTTPQAAEAATRLHIDPLEVTEPTEEISARASTTPSLQRLLASRAGRIRFES